MDAVDRNQRTWFWGLFALAVLARALNFNAFAMHHPDEVLQYLEPAYRLLGNEGIITWEYRYGMRSWLLPWLLAGPMAAGQLIGGNALSGIVVARIVAALIGLIPVIAAWHLGRRLSTTHGIVAMAVMAVWYEQVVFSTHLLTESLSTSLFLGAAALISREEGRSRVMAGGAMLAFAVVLRFHYGVAAGIFTLLALANDWKRWGWLIAGALPILALSSTIDISMGQWPFQWLWTNVQQNLLENRSADFGVQPANYFLLAIWGQWSWLTLPIVLLALEAGRQYRPILYAAVFNLAVHSLIGHKEYRFIELTIAALVLLAAVGSVNALQWLEKRRNTTLPPTYMLGGLLLSWAGASAWLGSAKPLDQWFGQRSQGPELVYLAGAEPMVCGIATTKAEFWQLSRAYLGRPMPIVLLDNTPRPFPRLKPPGPELASVNAVIAEPGAERVLPGYLMTKCKGAEPYARCLYIRPGTCTPTPEARDRDIQKVLADWDM